MLNGSQIGEKKWNRDRMKVRYLWQWPYLEVFTWTKVSRSTEMGKILLTLSADEDL